MIVILALSSWFPHLQRLRSFHASNLTLAGTVLALLNVRLGVPIARSILGARRRRAGRIVNGFCHLFPHQLLIVTLGVGTFIHGITLWLGNQQTISA